MNVERIRERLRKPGFKPFYVVMSSGDKYPVPHPEFILVTPREVFVADTRGDVAFLDALHIVGIEDIRREANGKLKPARKR
jgi:hypothetical protein